MPKKYLFVFFISYIVSGYSYASTDSLLSQKPSKDNYLEHCDLYDKLGKTFYDRSNYDSALWAYKKGVLLCKNYSNPKTLGNFYNQIGVVFLVKYSHDSAIYYFNETLTIAEALKDDTLKAISIANMGLVYKNKAEYNKAVPLLSEATKLYQNFGDTMKLAFCRYNLGNIYNKTGQYDKGIEVILKAAKTFEETHKTLNLAQCYNLMGTIFRELGNYEKSIEYHNKTLLLQKSIDNKRGIITSYINLGNTYSNQKKYSEAINSYSLANEVNTEYRNRKKQAKISTNLGEVYLITKNYLDAEKEIDIALEIFIDIGYHKEQAECLNLLSEIYLKTGRMEKASAFLKKAATIAKQYNLSNELLINLQLSKDYYLLNAQEKNAIQCFQKIDSLKDSIFSRQKHREVTNINTKYETEKKEQQITLLEKDKKIQLTEIKQKAQQRNWLIGFFVAMLIVSLIIYYYYKRTKAAKIKIETLQREIHHRVKNNLTIVKRMVGITQETVKDAKGQMDLIELSNRIAGMAQVHEQLYKKEDITNIDFKQYVNDLSKNITASFSQEDLVIEQQIEEGINISFNKAVPLGLIINELLTNAYKYSGTKNIKAKVSIKVTKGNDNLMIKVADNGKGFPDSLNLNSLTSYGLKLANGLTQQLNGTIKLYNAGGANVEVAVPV